MRIGCSGDDLHGLVHELAQVLVVVDDPHGAAAEHVGGADEHRVADLGGDRPAPRRSERAVAPAAWWSPSSVMSALKRCAILGAVDGVGRGAEDRHARVAAAAPRA